MYVILERDRDREGGEGPRLMGRTPYCLISVSLPLQIKSRKTNFEIESDGFLQLGFMISDSSAISKAKIYPSLQVFGVILSLWTDCYGQAS